ncbi:MAG TPA: AMP-binding protein, partial [Clostridia bacterium]
MNTGSILPNHLSEQEKQYWSEELGKPLPTMDIPVDFPHHGSKNLKITNTASILDKKLTQDLQEAYPDFNLQTIMLAAYFALSARLSNEKDIIIGANLNNTIYPIRVLIENLKNFEELLVLVKEKLDNAYEHSFIAGEIVNTNEDLFQTTFCMNPDEKLENETMLNWEIHEKETYNMINVQYDADLFKAKTIERFIKYYLNIIKVILAEPKTNIYGINILTEEELDIYNKLNNTKVPYPSSKSISQMFEQAVHKFPGNIAISSDKGQFTYKELNERANCLANVLIQKGLKKGDFVSIFMGRSLETIISIFGILKAGGVYVPLDPEHPEDRNSYILSDTKSPFIVTKSIYLDEANGLLTNSMYIKDIILIDNDLNNFPIEAPNIYIKPEDLAYVIYTSGSTGNPKGTLIAHQGVVNLGYIIHNEFKIDEKEILTQFSTYSFDASVWDTFGSLFWGARLHLLSAEERISVVDFANTIERTKATFITILPTVFFNQLATQLSYEDFLKLSTVKRIAVGGEALSGEVVRSFQKKSQNAIEIINLYGPTESTVVATGYRITDLIPEDQVNIPIGKPLSNYEVYIVNEENQFC